MFNHCKWHGYFRVKVNTGLTAENKTYLEGLDDGESCQNNQPCHNTKVRYSIDDKEAIWEGCLDSSPENGGISEDEFQMFTQASACQYISNNVSNWEATA
jgi:hypothetical protein